MDLLREKISLFPCARANTFWRDCHATGLSAKEICRWPGVAWDALTSWPPCPPGHCSLKTQRQRWTLAIKFGCCSTGFGGSQATTTRTNIDVLGLGTWSQRAKEKRLTGPGPSGTSLGFPAKTHLGWSPVRSCKRIDMRHALREIQPVGFALLEKTAKFATAPPPPHPNVLNPFSVHFPKEEQIY